MKHSLTMKKEFIQAALFLLTSFNLNASAANQKATPEIKSTTVKLYDFPAPILQNMYADGLLMPKLMATPWVAVQDNENLDSLKARLIGDLGAMFPNAIASASRFETRSFEDYWVNSSTNSNSTEKVDTASETKLLIFQKNTLKKSSTLEVQRSMQENRSNFRMVRYVVEFISISEADVLKTKARLSYEFSEKTKEIREKIDYLINDLFYRLGNSSGSPHYLSKYLITMQNIAINAIYIAKQQGLSALQTEEIIYLYNARINQIENLVKIGSYNRYISEDIKTNFNTTTFQILRQLPL